jgi:hypothetical protein
MGLHRSCGVAAASDHQTIISVGRYLPETSLWDRHAGKTVSSSGPVRRGNLR